jgi:hypothetical protein
MHQPSPSAVCYHPALHPPPFGQVETLFNNPKPGSVLAPETKVNITLASNSIAG